MENLHTPAESNNLPREHEIKLESSLYHSDDSNNHSAKNVSNISQNEDGSYSTQISFDPVDIKEEEMEDSGKKLSHPTISFHSGSLQGINSELKASSHQILSSEVPLVSQGVQLTSGGSILVNANENCQKVLPSHHSVVSLGQGVNFNSSLNLSNAVSQGASVVTCSQNNDVNHPVQMFHSSSFDNCESVLNQQQHSGQTFLLTSPGTVLSSNQLVSQGQVFLQGDELVGVTLAATSSAGSTGYTVSTSESQYANTLPVVLSGNQAIGNSIPRLIIQSSQAGATNLNNSILSSNNGHYIIQVGHTVPTVSHNNNLSLNNKGHIVIKAGGSKIKEESESCSSPSKEGVFRVVIPEGTTKLPRVSQPLPVAGNSDDSIRKHVQINLSNRSSLPSPSKLSYDTAVQTLKDIKPPEKLQVNSTRKLYECSNCNSKFMKPLYLRMHMRSCKKPEVKLEKSPLFMCSFCKSTFKTKPTIYIHFAKCSQSPYNAKEESGKRKANEEETSAKKKLKLELCDLDTALEMAVLFKCQDCDRTFSKERQYTSHIKRCTKISVHDLSGAKLEPPGISIPEEEHENPEDPFADPPLPTPHTVKKGRGGGGRRGRPPGKVANSAQKGMPKSSSLFEGEKVQASVSSMIVADDENLVRSTTGLAHTVQLSLESAKLEGHPQPNALIADSKGVRGMDRPPHAWSLICSLCQKMFLTKAALANHIIENHGSDLKATRNVLHGHSSEENLYKCPYCHLHYQTSNNIIEHLVIQHTSELQDHYKSLQSQMATFVCSLCSLVLLTKNLLMEHLSLEHLDYLEKIQINSQYSRRRYTESSQGHSGNGEVNISNNEIEYRKNSEEEIIKEEIPLALKSEDGEGLECGFCGEDFESSEFLVSHYSQAHNVHLDSDGNVVDDGIDVDIRVKSTKRLLQLADGKSCEGTTLPEKTVLIRKKPKQSWQCQTCLLIFTKQMAWLRHLREACPSANQHAGEGSKTTTSRESHFLCHELECTNLAFYQVKSLFKHMEEVHKIVIPKERRTFQSLSAFHEWLTEEENSKVVRFLRDSTRVEKGNVRLIQMVCHRFHTAKLEQSKEKDEWDVLKPSKKRWSSRAQKVNNCHARIHLRVEFNSSSNEYDGETQMIYYPKHFHNGMEDTQEMLDKIREKHPRDKSLGSVVMKNTTSNNNCFAEGDSGSSFSLDSTSDILQLQTDDNSCEGQQHKLQQQQQQLHHHHHIQNNSNTVAGHVTSMVVSHQSSSPSVIIPQATQTRSSVIFDGGEQAGNKRLIMESGDDSPFIVMNTEDQRSNEETQDYSEEYVLPADDAEWTKLFDVLTTRLSSGELSEEEIKEGTALLSYRNLIAVITVSEQVSIFQKMCALTNTSLESV